MTEPQKGEFLPLDETVWQGWVARNERERHSRIARRLEISVLLTPIALAAIAIWFFAR